MKSRIIALAVLLALGSGSAFAAGNKASPASTRHASPAAAVAATPGITSAPAAKPLTPAHYQQMYYDAWFSLGEQYYDPSKLSGWKDWQHRYDGKLTTEQELDAALKALTGSLHDQWTGYQSSHERLLDVFASVRGLINLGMVLKPADDGAYKVSIAPYGTLARLSGIQAGDVIESIGGVVLRSLSQDKVDALLTVQGGPDVPVTYVADGVRKTVSMKTTQPEVRYAEAKMLPGKILYARLSSYMDSAHLALFYSEVSRVLSSGDADGLLLDWRGNAGGKIELVQKQAAFFVPGRTIMRVQTRNANLVTSSEIKANRLLDFELDGLAEGQKRMMALFSGKPIVILVDGSTASAAEVFTGALLDNGRAIVVGTDTYRKGVGFDEVDVPTGGVLTVTSLKYLTPSGSDVSVAGIHPTIVVPARRDGVDNQAQVGVVELQKLIANR